MPSKADHAVTVINLLTHTQSPWAGQPFRLRPWQETIVRKLFTTRRDGLRKYRTCLLMLPRKNGKTELAAAIAIYCLLADGEIGGEIYLAAADREQAGKVFSVMAAMIQNDPTLDAQCEIALSQKRIVHRASRSFCKAISAEAYSKHGFNASVVIYDELHCAPTRELWDVLATSQGARQQPILMAISTAGYDRHSILYELYSHAKAVATQPSIDPTFLPILYEAPQEADWTDVRVWRKANPALGDFRSLEEMQTACARAQEIPAQENAFRRLYLNQWTEQAARWLALTAWDACRGMGDPATWRGRRCYVGLDLSATTDLTAAVAVFPDEAGGGFDVLPAFFVPAESMRERVRRDRVPYDEWVKQGRLTATPGATVDYEAVRRQLQVWRALYDVRTVAYDPWNATDLVNRLEQQDGFRCVARQQGFSSFSAPSKALETAILARTLRHDGHPVLRWNVAHVAVEQDAGGNLKPSKPKSSDRIDGVVALIMALDALARDKTPSYDLFVLG